MEKTVEIVKTAIGWHVTRRYCGRSIATQFFSTVAKDLDKKKTESAREKAIKKASEDAVKAKNDYVQAWVGA